MFIPLSLWCLMTFAACSNEEPVSRGEFPVSPPQEEKPTEEFKASWNVLVNNEISENEIYIGSRYLGIQNWPCNGNPPQIYLGATFPQSTFATSFDREVADEKSSIDVWTDFSDPYTAAIERPCGTAYMQFLKDMQRSDEYKKYQNIHRPVLHKLRLGEAKAASDIKAFFPDNERFGETIGQILLQTINMKKVNSWTVGEVIYRGFTVTMDVPSKGLFTNPPENQDELVYMRSMTYGATGYFVIASDKTYQEVLTGLTKSSITDIPQDFFSNSQIVLLTTCNADQNAVLQTSFADLKAFAENPFHNDSFFGYPVYCTGCYVKENLFFHVGDN